MRTKLGMPFLKRCGLTLEKIAEVACATDPREFGEPSSFSMQMLNDVKLSDFRRPSVPTAKGCIELLRVELHNDLLTIADIKGQRRNGTGGPVESHGARLYALKTVRMPGATAFMFLSKPPAGVTDEKFCAARGTAILYDNAQCGPRVLKASGVDQGNGQRCGWIFDAVET
jgi:hypothetical protein